MKLDNYRLYIFDFDYTLFNTFKAQAHCAKTALAAFGISDIEENAIRRSMGVPLREFFGHYTNDPLTIESMEKTFWQSSAATLAELAEPCNSTIPVITALNVKGAKLAIVTGNSRDRVSRILERFSLDGMFHLLVCVDEIAQPKPDPEGLLKCLSHFGNVGKDETIYVGDHYYDIMAAQRCGIDVVAVATGTSSREELIGYKPNFVIDDLSELL